mmetsp:Transcript_18627/g.40099  ORF Transcript_18627/g.40099 Transcript_18627/m.40099 type:complete len:229 (+) Transcript_18627:355-1041(+)
MWNLLSPHCCSPRNIPMESLMKTRGRPHGPRTQSQRAVLWATVSLPASWTAPHFLRRDWVVEFMLSTSNSWHRHSPCPPSRGLLIARRQHRGIVELLQMIQMQLCNLHQVPLPTATNLTTSHPSYTNTSANSLYWLCGRHPHPRLRPWVVDVHCKQFQTRPCSISRIRRRWCRQLRPGASDGTVCTGAPLRRCASYRQARARTPLLRRCRPSLAPSPAGAAPPRPSSP